MFFYARKSGPKVVQTIFAFEKSTNLARFHAINMIQRDSTFEYARKLVFEKTGGQEDFNTKLLELSDMDEDIYVMNVIHKDLDIILNDVSFTLIHKFFENLFAFFINFM